MPVPVINVNQMRAWESATWALGRTEAGVIRRVGEKIAARVLGLTRPGAGILILAGKGHNGDDARAAKKFLAGRKVATINVASPVPALSALRTALLKKPALIVDGLFGVGLNRPLADGWLRLIAAVNESKIPVLAVDVPSGLNADTGEIFGAAIEAMVTLTVGAPKLGLLSQRAWPFVGRLEIVEQVGLVPCPLNSRLNWTLPDDFQNYPPPRAVAAHKGSYGHLAIVAGSVGFHGAAVLTARAAQRARPGRLTLFTDAAVYGVVASQLQAVMVASWRPQCIFPDSTSAILVGPGLAASGIAGKLVASTRKLWRASALPVVVDASALDWLPSGRFAGKAIRVVTPHPGEAARLLKTTARKIQENRVAALRDISGRLGDCWVVLKGHQTLVGRSFGDVFVNPSGNPHLAQGGTGDLLAGFLAGLLAQPVLQADPGKTIRYAVWSHGAAADRLSARCANWVVEELAAELGR